MRPAPGRSARSSWPDSPRESGCRLPEYRFQCASTNWRPVFPSIAEGRLALFPDRAFGRRSGGRPAFDFALSRVVSRITYRGRSVARIESGIETWGNARHFDNAENERRLE